MATNPEKALKQNNKATSWAAAVFIIGLSATLLAPLLYIAVIGKVEAHKYIGVFALQIFDVVSHPSGKFNITYGLGAIAAPAVLSLAVWAVLLAILLKQ